MNSEEKFHHGSTMHGVEQTIVQITSFKNIFHSIPVNVDLVSDI